MAVVSHCLPCYILCTSGDGSRSFRMPAVLLCTSWDGSRSLACRWICNTAYILWQQLFPTVCLVTYCVCLAVAVVLFACLLRCCVHLEMAAVLLRASGFATLCTSCDGSCFPLYALSHTVYILQSILSLWRCARCLPPSGKIGVSASGSALLSVSMTRGVNAWICNTVYILWCQLFYRCLPQHMLCTCCDDSHTCRMLTVLMCTSWNNRSLVPLSLSLYPLNMPTHLFHSISLSQHTTKRLLHSSARYNPSWWFAKQYVPAR